MTSMNHADAQGQVNALLAAALDYAAAGLPVLPCEHAGKRPLTRNGKDDATTDPAMIREWWTRWPSANVAVRPPAGIVVLDVDVRADGHRSLVALLAEHGPLPRTLAARTGGGGAHIWLAAPGPFRGRLAEGIDAKTCTGYLIAPPSVHPSGARYRWHTLAPTAPAPGWVRTMLAPPVPRVDEGAHQGTGSITSLAEWVTRQPEGNRNHGLFWACRRAIESGARDLNPLVTAACRAGLSPHEAERTAMSALRAGGAA